MRNDGLGYLMHQTQTGPTCPPPIAQPDRSFAAFMVDASTRAIIRDALQRRVDDLHRLAGQCAAAGSDDACASLLATAHSVSRVLDEVPQ